MSTTAYYLAATVLAVFIGILASRELTEPLQPKTQHGTVGYIYDGDTIALTGPQKRVLRLWGVDAPEKSKKGFQRAKIALQSLLENQSITFIEIDRDRYGRIVARIFLKDGREVNRLMIESGAAKECCRYSKGFYSAFN